MRILQITHQYPPHHIGGVELLTQQLARNLAQLGHEVSVLTRALMDTPIAQTTLEQVDGITVCRLPEAANPTQRFLATFQDRNTLAASLRLIETMQPDVVHLQHLMGFPLSLIDALYRRGIPYVISLHDYWFACANAQLITNFDQHLCDGPTLQRCARCAAARAGLPQALSAAFMLPLARRQALLKPVLQRAQTVVANSRFVQTWFAQHGYPSHDWPIIEYGLDTPETPATATSLAHSRPRSFAYVGGLSWQKGVHVLIEAFNALPADATLTLAGDLQAFPDYIIHLRQLATHPGIRFVGKLNRAEVWALLNETEVIAVPALWHETASLIAREALAAGCYVLVSDLGAMSELIAQHPQRGQALPPNHVDAWRQAMQNLTAFVRRPQPMPSVMDYAGRVEGILVSCTPRNPL